jgi:outer membrane protein OmpA-like peptidoglycan-associated protein
VENARVTGRGERELRVHTADGVDEPANRRVEVILR